jgi:rod shape-determining protein MreD
VTLALAFVAAAVASFALRSVAVPQLLGACRPLLLVVVGSARRHAPAAVAWLGCLAGLLGDVLSGRVIGPGGVAGAAGGALMAALVRRFELQGPLFWIVGTLIVAGCSESVNALLLTSLGANLDHGWLGGLAAVAVTTLAGALVAVAQMALRAWRSPERRRRRALRRG